MTNPKKGLNWQVYILECKDGSFYTGITNDLERRLTQHYAGTASRYTRSRGVVGIHCASVFMTKSQALRAEARYKRLSHKQKLQLIW